MFDKTKQINIRISEKVYDALKSEADKQKVTLTKLCCQGINLLITSLYSVEVDKSPKNALTDQLITLPLENSTSSIPPLDFKMAKLQELENRISNVERALIQLLESIPSQINSLAISSELNSSSAENVKMHEATTESGETLSAPTSYNVNGKDAATVNATDETANTHSSRKPKGGGVSKPPSQNSTSAEGESTKPSKSGRIDCCPRCQSFKISKNGHDRYGNQMYLCKDCKKSTPLKP